MTTQRPPEYAQLLKINLLEGVQPTRGAVAGFIKNASSYLAVAQALEAGGVAAAEPLHIFTNAYEGFHQLVQAVLEHFEVRTKDAGRNLAILRVSADLKFTPDEVATVSRAHTQRNHSSYRSPFPPISRQDAKNMLDILIKSIPLVQALTKAAAATKTAATPAPLTAPAKKSTR
jgi:hypothetical protein